MSRSQNKRIIKITITCCGLKFGERTQRWCGMRRKRENDLQVIQLYKKRSCRSLIAFLYIIYFRIYTIIRVLQQDIYYILVIFTTWRLQVHQKYSITIYNQFNTLEKQLHSQHTLLCARTLGDLERASKIAFVLNKEIQENRIIHR